MSDDITIDELLTLLALIDVDIPTEAALKMTLGQLKQAYSWAKEVQVDRRAPMPSFLRPFLPRIKAKVIEIFPGIDWPVPPRNALG